MRSTTAARARRRVAVAISALALIAASARIAYAGLSPRVIAPLLGVLYPDVRSISASELSSRLRSASPPTLLDARTEPEIAVSTLRGAQALDPERAEVSAGPIVVYCSVGLRSAIVARELAREGGREVLNLEGGIFGWANESRPVHRGARVVREVHPFDGLWAVFLEDELEAYSSPAER